MNLAEVVPAEEQSQGRIQVGPLLAERVRQPGGFLKLMGMELPCYVLDNWQRVVGRTSFTEMITGIKGGGGLEKYLGVEPLKPFISLEDVLERNSPAKESLP